MGSVRPSASLGKPDAAARRALLDSMEAQQTLNEELQSRNEELETVNEELQSLNDEIQVQGDEARRATLFLGAMLEAGPDVSVVETTYLCIRFRIGPGPSPVVCVDQPGHSIS